MTLNIYFKCNLFNKKQACLGGWMLLFGVWIPSTTQKKENFEGVPHWLTEISTIFIFFWSFFPLYWRFIVMSCRSLPIRDISVIYRDIFFLSCSSFSSTINCLINSLTESPVNDPSRLSLSTSNPARLSSRSLATNLRSEEAPRKRINTRPNPRASITEFQPQWVKNPPIDRWAKIYFCGSQLAQTKPRPETRDSNPVIIGSSLVLTTQMKGKSDFSIPDANSFISPWLRVNSVPIAT